MTLRLELIIILMCQFKGTSAQIEHLYNRVGEDVLLPFNVDGSSNQCSDVMWLYNRPKSNFTEQLNRGNQIKKPSARASRLSVSSNCSLLIRNINDEDAGRYVQRVGGKDTLKHLHILNISSSPSDVYERVNLTCSLRSYDDPGVCKQNSIIWVNERGSQLSGEDVESRGQTNCVSVLTVKRQSGNTKKITCQFVKNGNVKTNAVFVLTGISEKTERLYERVGDDVVLPCRVKSSSSSSCSIVNWLYPKDSRGASIEELFKGKVDQGSARASRLKMSSDCSLIIRNITDEDAGQYNCSLGNWNGHDASVFLNVLSISKDSREVNPRGNGDITLQCSLNRYDKRIPCKENSIIWRDERGSHLTGEGVWFEFRGQTNCVSVLTVKHQSGNNKRFTCKFIEDNRVKIDAVYSLDLSESPQSNTPIIIGAVVGVVLVLLVVVTVLLCRTKRAKITRDQDGETDFQKPTPHIREPEIDLQTESDLAYATVIHSKSKSSSKITINSKECEVTYSSIKMK
ncbi:obscurin-like [Oryzias melastigma]|uniref:obscurin-like n=1 Tax=Oryzias melastigma TaxID=30732 RepID=UPI00168D78BE|nr:obscurin-like [Oryzias melastigma]